MSEGNLRPRIRRPYGRERIDAVWREIRIAGHLWLPCLYAQTRPRRLCLAEGPAKAMTALDRIGRVRRMTYGARLGCHLPDLSGCPGRRQLRPLEIGVDGPRWRSLGAVVPQHEHEAGDQRSLPDIPWRRGEPAMVKSGSLLLSQDTGQSATITSILAQRGLSNQEKPGSWSVWRGRGPCAEGSVE